MSNIHQKQTESQKNNVIPFPRISTYKKQIAVLPRMENRPVDAFDVERSAFGFAAGETLICATLFEPSEIKPSTVVITENERGDLEIACNVAIGRVRAIALYAMREVL